MQDVSYAKFLGSEHAALSNFLYEVPVSTVRPLISMCVDVINRLESTLLAPPVIIESSHRTYCDTVQLSCERLDHSYTHRRQAKQPWLVVVTTPECVIAGNENLKLPVLHPLQHCCPDFLFAMA